MYSGYYFPLEIHSQILLHLPPKSLLRFRSVCKSWYSLITNPNFISSHLNLQIAAAIENPDLPLFLTEGDDMHSIWRNGEEIPDRTWLGCPWEKEEGFVYYASGSCNGLVCMFSYLREVFLWNPSIRKSMELDPVPVGDFDSDFIAVGLGFDSGTDDFMVVAITYYDHLSHEIWPTPNPYAHVYSVKSGIWRNIGFPFYHPEYDEDWNALSHVSVSQAFFNCVIHWIVSRSMVGIGSDSEDDEERLDDLGTSILTFDVKSEIFGELALPGCIADDDYPNLSIGVVEDSIALFHCSDKECTLFILEEYGLNKPWVWLFKVKLPGPCVRVLCLRNDFELLVILEGGVLAFLDPYATQESYSYHSYISESLGSAFPCLESLVLLDKWSKPSWCEVSEQL